MMSARIMKKRQKVLVSALIFLNLASLYLVLIQGVKNMTRPRADIDWIEEIPSKIKLSRVPDFEPSPFLRPLNESELDHLKQRLKVNLNNASVDELTTLKGIGVKLARQIVLLREQKGRIGELNALLEIDGIGPKKIESLRHQIVLEEPDEQDH